MTNIINIRKIWEKLTKQDDKKSYKFYRACINEYIKDMENLRGTKNLDETIEKISKMEERLNNLRGYFKKDENNFLKHEGNYEEFIKLKEKTFDILEKCQELKNYFNYIFSGYKIDYSSYAESENISFILSLYIVLAIYKKDVSFLDDKKISNLIYEAGIKIKNSSKTYIKISLDVAKEEINENC